MIYLYVCFVVKAVKKENGGPGGLT